MDGDAERAARFFRHLEPLQGALEAYCRRSLRDANAVADVLQNVAVQALRSFDQFAEGTNFRAWIFRFVHWELVAFRRRESRTETLIDAADVPDRGSSDGMLDERLFETLKNCPEAVLDRCDETLAAAVLDLAPAERAVVLLRAIGDFSYREMADILDIPLGTVMSHLARARVQLRRRLADYCREHRIRTDETST